MKKSYTVVIRYIPIDQIKDSPYQPRVDYGNIEGLAASIKNNGLRDPLLIRSLEVDYEIVDGHRRIRALRYLGATFVACHVVEMDDKEAIEMALLENIQRKNFSPLEEGRAFKEYLEMFDISQSAFARKIGKDTMYMNHRIRLLNFPKEIQDKIASGEIRFSSAVAMLTIIDRKKDILSITKKILEGNLEGTIQVKDTVEAVKKGADIEEAVKVAKYRSFERERAKRRAEGKSVKEILEEIRRGQIGSEEILKADRRGNLNIVKKMLSQGVLVCPKCGKSHLSWMCCGEELS